MKRKTRTVAADVYAPGEGQAIELLVVGLDAAQRMRFEYRLLEAGFALRTVAFTESLSEARGALLRISPECILVDLGLSEPSGVHAVTVLAAAAPEVPIVVTSSSGCDPDLVYEALSSGAVDHIVDEGWQPIPLRDVITRAYRRHEEVRMNNEFRRVLESVLATVDGAACVLDQSGRIVAVNEAWTSDGESRGGEWSKCGVGANYLSVCERAAADELDGAAAAVDGIRAVLRGKVPRFAQQHRFDVDGEARWFDLRVMPYAGRDGGAVVVYSDVTVLKEAEQRLEISPEWAQRILGDEYPVFAMVGADGTISYVSDSTLQLLGGTESEGLPSFFSIELHDRTIAERAFEQVLKSPGARERFVVHVVDGTGHVRALDLEVCNRVDDPLIGAVTVAGRDVTEEQREDVAHGPGGQLADRVPAGIVAWDRDGSVLSWNAGAADLFGHSAEEALGSPVFELGIWPDEARVEVDAAMSVPGARWDGEYEAKKADGSTVRVRAALQPIDDESDAAFGGVVAAYLGVPGSEPLDPELAYRALHDGLTGLPGRRLFVGHLGLAVSRGARAGRLTAVLSFSLDGPERVEPRGRGRTRRTKERETVPFVPDDDALRTVAERLAAALRPGDVLARLEGDEFVVCCADLGEPAEALAVAERARQAVTHPATQAESPELSLSAGVAISEPDTTADDLLGNASFALRLAKASGRGRLELFDAERHRRAREQIEMGLDLGEAVELGDIEVAYQPIYVFDSGEICGFEALARWTHPEWGPVEPQDFIRAAELSGSIAPLGERVLTIGCAVLAQMRERAGDRQLSMTVNLSALQLADPEFPETVRRIVERAGVPPSSVCLEVTEAALADADVAAEALRTLRELGVQTSIDDFGTEYSSMSRLHQFPIDYLKIDRSFVSGLVDRPVDAAIVHALLGLATSLNVKSVAEGVEDETQLKLLEAAGCDLGQGFYWSKPLPAEEALDLLGP